MRRRSSEQAGVMYWYYNQRACHVVWGGVERSTMGVGVAFGATSAWKVILIVKLQGDLVVVRGEKRGADADLSLCRI